MNIPKPNSVSDKKLLEFALLLCCLVSGVRFAYELKNSQSISLYALIFILSLTGVVALRLLRPIYNIVYAIGRILAKVNNFIILGFIFYIIFGFYKILYLIANKDPLKVRQSKQGTTYWESSDSEIIDLTKQY